MINEFMYWMFMIFLILFISTIIIVGFFFFYRYSKTKLSNILFIGIGFILVAIGFIGSLILGLGLVFEEIFVSSGFICSIIFTNQTFHKNQESPGKKILIICIILAILQIIFQALLMMDRTPLIYFLKICFDLPYTLLVFSWMAWSSHSAYKNIKDNDEIQQWIKMRYKLITISSIIISLNSVPEFFIPWDVGYGNPNNIYSFLGFGIMATLAVLFAICFGLAWLMPKRFKLFLNRKHGQIEEKELSESELLDMIHKQLNGN